MVVTPAATPVTMPLEVPMEAVAAFALLHAPPPTRSVKVVVAPVQTLTAPDIVDGERLTVTGAVMKQPVGNV